MRIIDSGPTITQHLKTVPEKKGHNLLSAAGLVDMLGDMSLIIPTKHNYAGPVRDGAACL